MRRLRIAVIIPNRDGVQHLEYSLASLSKTKSKKFEMAVVLVDNDSSDNSVEYVSENFPDFKIIELSENLGFAGGVNLGIQWALDQDVDYIAIYNNDIKVLPEWIDVIVGEFEQDANIGALGYTEIGRDEEHLLHLPDKITFKELSGAPAGCLYVCRSGMFEHIGLYDPVYFMYGEELDLFERAHKAGYRILESNVPVWHYGGGTAQYVPLKVAWLSHRNTIRFALKTQSFGMIYRHIRRLFFLACAPLSVESLVKFLAWRRSVTESSVATTDVNPTRLQQQIKRVRPRTPLFNFFLFLGAIIWNVLHLPQTYFAKMRDFKGR